MKVVTMLPLDSWRSVGSVAQAAEENGYDAVMTAEVAHDPFAPLALAAVATTRLELSTGIAVAFPRSPMIMAGQAWDLQAESGGRFSLGLGSQVKGHNVRRFGLSWSPPVPRLREYIEALRAIWRCWERGEKLDYAGDHYRFSLMTPEFSPRPTGLPMVPVAIAAVGPDMLRLAGRVCDGVRLHGFCTRRYIEDVCMPRVSHGLAEAGRQREHFEISGGGFIATGPDADAVRRAMDAVRVRVAFYGSTRTYLPVLAAHGLEELGSHLHRLSVEGKWTEMPAEISDEVLHLFAAVAPFESLAAEVEKRFGGAVDVIHLDIPSSIDPGVTRELIQDIRQIRSDFRSFSTET